MTVGASLIWLPFAALTVLSLLLVFSRPGLGERDGPALVGLGIVVVLPIAIWLTFRIGGVVATLLVVLLGVAIPVLWAPLVQPDHSEPLHLITRLTVIGGTAMVLGGLLMIGRPAPGR